MAVVRQVLYRIGIRGWVYLDDILLSARRRAVRDCKRELRRARFIGGARSETTPSESMSFMMMMINAHNLSMGFFPIFH